MQLDLLSDVLGAYQAADRPLDNQSLYRAVAERAALSEEDTGREAPIGKSRVVRNTYHRKVRWFDILPSLSLRCRLATERKGIPRLLPSWFLLPRRLPEGMAWLSP